jgi:hypothetical protein
MLSSTSKVINQKVSLHCYEIFTINYYQQAGAELCQAILKFEFPLTWMGSCSAINMSGNFDDLKTKLMNIVMTRNKLRLSDSMFKLFFVFIRSSHFAPLSYAAVWRGFVDEAEASLVSVLPQHNQ